eukprot:5046532-Alexandrium_andersonii.AAC.1
MCIRDRGRAVRSVWHERCAVATAVLWAACPHFVRAVARRARRAPPPCSRRPSWRASPAHKASRQWLRP